MRTKLWRVTDGLTNPMVKAPTIEKAIEKWRAYIKKKHPHDVKRFHSGPMIIHEGADELI